MRSLGKSDFAGLAKYITDAQSKEHRLGDVQVTNCHAGTLNAAIEEILATQHLNTRAKGDKTYHLLVSFRAGESPDGDTLKAIEERICAGLGYAEHQRISAVHNDTDNLHLHLNWLQVFRFKNRRLFAIIFGKVVFFELFWKFKSKGPGRPQVDREIRNLVRKIAMAMANPSWGAPRIHGELLKLGFDVSERTVSNLMPRQPPNTKPSQTWRTFLKNHANKCSMDFFTVPTAAFNILFVLVILCHSRRKVVHFNVTSNPTAQWTAQQVVEAFPWDTAPKYLMRDRDSIYGDFFAIE
jgi:hypothetical protein